MGPHHGREEQLRALQHRPVVPLLHRQCPEVLTLTCHQRGHHRTGTAGRTTAKACKALQELGCKAPPSPASFQGSAFYKGWTGTELHPWGNSLCMRTLRDSSLSSSLHDFGKGMLLMPGKPGLEAERSAKAVPLVGCGADCRWTKP